MKNSIKFFICCIIILIILAAGSTYENQQNARNLVNHLPKQMVEYICNETGYDSTKISGQIKIHDYYLNNFNKLEDMAYEYNWYND